MAGRQMKRNQLVAFADAIKTRFDTSPYWEHVKFLSNGSYGVTVLLREVNRLVVRQRRVCLKLAWRNGVAPAQLRDELKWLKKLRGARHIVKMIAHCDDLNSYQNEEQKRRDQENRLGPVVDALGPLQRLPPNAIFGPLHGLMEGPAIALEYIDQGDLVSLKLRMDADQIIPPNRVLWAIFLCLIRGCIGIAYPLERAAEAPTVLETIGNGRPSALIHNDIAARNVMIQSGDGLDEHHIGYFFKMIDFGAMKEYGYPMGPPENLYDCARMLLQMMDCQKIPTYPVTWKGFVTRAGGVLPPEDDLNDDPFPQIDFDLRDLVARCMYVVSAQRPTLQEALALAQAALRRAPDDFPDEEEETDESIRDLFEEYLYDVPDSQRMRV